MDSATAKCEGTVTGGRSLRRARLDDDGIGVIEVLMAFSVFMLCFLPLVLFLSTGARVIANASAQRFATSVANTTLSNEQTSTTPAAWSLPQVAQTWTTAIGTTALQGGVRFQLYTLRGWCAFNPSAGAWDSTMQAGDHASFHVTVKVAWGPSPTSTNTANVVVDTTELTSTTGAPVAGNSVAACSNELLGKSS
jgi:Tfp pilus assembly protein PilV